MVLIVITCGSSSILNYTCHTKKEEKKKSVTTCLFESVTDLKRLLSNCQNVLQSHDTVLPRDIDTEH